MPFQVLQKQIFFVSFQIPSPELSFLMIHSGLIQARHRMRLPSR